MSHDDLRALAEAATPGPWHLESHWEPLCGPRETTTTWYIPGLARWHGLPTSVHFAKDEATARYVTAVSPDVVIDLLNMQDTLRRARRITAESLREQADELERGERSPHMAAECMREQADDLDPPPGGLVPPWERGDDPDPPAGDLVVTVEASADRVVYLMDALERAVADAKAARARHRKSTEEEPR